MRKLLLLLCALTLLTLPHARAAAEADALDALAGCLLSAGLSGEYLDRETADALAARLTEAGVAVPDAFGAGDEPLYVYDHVLGLCELAYGDYYDWSIELRHRFDQLMVDAGQLAACFNLLPGADELSQEEACALAFSAIEERYGLACDPAWDKTFASYVAVASGSQHGVWRFGIDHSSGVSFAVLVRGGEVTACEQVRRPSGLEDEYARLCEERGAFFKWSLQEKMDFADALPEKLAQTRQRDELLPSEKELEAIARYGFCLPDGDALSQEEAYAIASDAVMQAYGLPQGWDASTEVYYSFFLNDESRHIWRVIFWKTGNSAYGSGVVDLDAATGEVRRVEKNGSTPNEFIPYIDRL